MALFYFYFSFRLGASSLQVFPQDSLICVFCCCWDVTVPPSLPQASGQVIRQFFQQLLIHHPLLLTLEYLIPGTLSLLPHLSLQQNQLEGFMGAILRISESLGLSWAQESAFLTRSHGVLKLLVHHALMGANAFLQPYVNRLISFKNVSLHFFESE